MAPHQNTPALSCPSVTASGMYSDVPGGATTPHYSAVIPTDNYHSTKSSLPMPEENHYKQSNNSSRRSCYERFQFKHNTQNTLFYLALILLGRPRRRWEDGIRMDLREIGLGGCGLDSNVSGRGPVAGCCECSDEPSGSCATELVSYSIH
jgi:hypothetical protein